MKAVDKLVGWVAPQRSCRAAIVLPGDTFPRDSSSFQQTAQSLLPWEQSEFGWNGGRDRD